jgi:hypothetical protein
MELNCPTCEGRLALVSFPTVEQIRAAAAEGHPEAVSMLTHEAKAEEFSTSQKRSRRSLNKLPKSDGDHLQFHLETIHSGDGMSPKWLILLCNGTEIYRERSGYEHWEAVITIGEAVNKQFAGRIAWFDPADAGSALLGDNMRARGHIQDFLNDTGIAPPHGRWSPH